MFYKGITLWESIIFQMEKPIHIFLSLLLLLNGGSWEVMVVYIRFMLESCVYSSTVCKYDVQLLWVKTAVEGLDIFRIFTNV